MRHPRARARAAPPFFPTHHSSRPRAPFRGRIPDADGKRLTGVPEGDRPVILVAIQPRLYASAIGSVIRRLRPWLDLRIVEPGDLTAEVRRLGPRLVLCSQPRGWPGDDGDPAWVEFYPYAETPKIRIRANGRCSTLEDADLKDLLSIVDHGETRSPANGSNARGWRGA